MVSCFHTGLRERREAEPSPMGSTHWGCCSKLSVPGQGLHTAAAFPAHPDSRLGSVQLLNDLYAKHRVIKGFEPGGINIESYFTTTGPWGERRRFSLKTGKGGVILYQFNPVTSFGITLGLEM